MECLYLVSLLQWQRRRGLHASTNKGGGLHVPCHHQWTREFPCQQLQDKKTPEISTLLWLLLSMLSTVTFFFIFVTISKFLTSISPAVELSLVSPVLAAYIYIAHYHQVKHGIFYEMPKTLAMSILAIDINSDAIHLSFYPRGKTLKKYCTRFQNF